MQVKRFAKWGVVAALCAATYAGPVFAAGTAPIIEAARANDTAAVRALLKTPAAARAATADGTTALHWATDADNLEMAALLVRAGADVKARNRYGVTPAYSAALNGNARMLELLLDAGVPVDTALQEGETLLMTAAKTGKVDAVRLLLKRGANVNAVETWKDQTALMWAAHEGNADAVKLLVEAGAKVDARSMSGWTPFLFAARQGQNSAVAALLDAGADINQVLPDGTGALVNAVQGQNFETAALLLERGADPNATGQGWTALHQIAYSRRPQRGQNNPGQRPEGKVSSLQLARLLVEHGADINMRQTGEPTSDMEGRNSLTRYGATPLFLAAKSVDVPYMEVLLELGADPFITNVVGDSPLLVAAGVGVYSQGESPGLPEESADAVKILLDLGATVDDVDKDGETVMHGPAWRGSNEAVMLLLNAGAKLDVRNNRGWLPLTIAAGVYHNARIMMNTHTASLLKEQMALRGLDTNDTADTHGAIRSEIEDAAAAGADNPQEIQRRLIEQQKKQQEELLKLQQQAK